jgi:hypothetical protein
MNRRQNEAQFSRSSLLLLLFVRLRRCVSHMNYRHTQEALAAGVDALSSMATKHPVVPQQSFPSLKELGLSESYFIAGAAAVVGTQTAVRDAPADWSNLSLSALKRKTEAELRDYLASQGLLQGNKKDLKKADLLALVMDMA